MCETCDRAEGLVRGLITQTLDIRAKALGGERDDLVIPQDDGSEVVMVKIEDHANLLEDILEGPQTAALALGVMATYLINMLVELAENEGMSVEDYWAKCLIGMEQYRNHG